MPLPRDVGTAYRVPMPRIFDIVPLRSLAAVATTGGVHRAAQALLISQSAASQHLRRLEKEAGAPLVLREGRGIAFTPEGERLLAHARAILAAHDDAVRSFDKERESIVVGGAQNSAAFALPLVMGELRDRLPEFDLRFHLDRNTTVRQMLADGDVDIAITPRVAPEIRPRERGFRLRWLWSADPAHPVALTDPTPLVVFSPPCTIRQPSFDSFSAAGRRWSVAAEINDLATALEAVRGGVGAMLVPLLDRCPDGLAELPAAPPVPAIQVAVVHSEHTPPELVDATREILAEHIGAGRVETHHHASLAMP